MLLSTFSRYQIFIGLICLSLFLHLCLIELVLLGVTFNKYLQSSTNDRKRIMLYVFILISLTLSEPSVCCMDTFTTKIFSMSHVSNGSCVRFLLI